MSAAWPVVGPLLGCLRGQGMKVFISYSRAERAVADRLVADLEARAFDVLIDRQDLPYGEEWQGQLGALIRSSDTVVWLASATSVNSRWVKWELGEVQRINKRLIPIRISPLDAQDLPEALGRIHILPAEGVYDPDRHFEELVKALETDRDWMETHTRLADRAAEWLDRDRPRDRLLRGRALREAEEWRDNRPERAPAPDGDSMDLLLQSRRAATRGLRTLAGAAVALAIVMIGLSVFAGLQWLTARSKEAEAIAQASAAETARDQAQLESARIAVSLAADLPARGQADQALLVLLDAAKTFGSDLPADWQVAMQQALDAVDGRTIIPIPVGSLPFETRNGLYYEDPATHDLWLYDGGDDPKLALKGAAGDSPFAAMDIGPAGLIAIRANLDVVLISNRTSQPVGQFTGQLSHYPEGKEGNDIWTIDPDGWVLRDVGFSDPDQLMDTTTGFRLDLPARPYHPIYAHLPNEGRFIVEAGFDDEEDPSPILEVVDGALVSLPTDVQLIARAKFADCMQGGQSRPFDFSQHVVDSLDEAGFFRSRCAITEELDYANYVLMTGYVSGSSGVNRTDSMVEFGEGVSKPYDRSLAEDIEYGTSEPLGDGEFSWTGVSHGETGAIGAIFNRGVFVQWSGFSSALARFEPERPAMGVMLGDDRIAVVEPRAGRLVIFDYTRGPFRPAIYSQREDQNGDKSEPLEADLSCIGYGGSLDITLPSGTALNFAQEADGLPVTLRFGSAPDIRSIELPLGQYCKRASMDWTRVMVSGAGETRLLDVERLATGASVADATISMLPQALDLAVVAPASGVIFSRFDEVNVQRWRIDASGQWRSDIVYEGNLELGQIEPNADGSALLLLEYQPASYVRQFLYSVDARAIWVELLRDYKPSTVGIFSMDGTVDFGGMVLRMPAPDALIAEAEFRLATSCTPPTPANYRSSPCWPDWL